MKFLSTYKFAFLISIGLHSLALWTFDPIFSGIQNSKINNQTILLALKMPSSNSPAVKAVQQQIPEKQIQEELPEKPTKNLAELETAKPKTDSAPSHEVLTPTVDIEPKAVVSKNTNSKDNKEPKEKKSHVVKTIPKKKLLTAKLAQKKTTQQKLQSQFEALKPATRKEHKPLLVSSSKSQKSIDNINAKNEQKAGFEAARFLNLSQPEYPYSARVKRYEGTVVFEISISDIGKVTNIKTTQSSGYAILDRISRQAIKKAEVEPARKNGQPISSIKTLRFTYRLNQQS